MMSFGALGFLNPAVLAGLIALPVLWWLLRAIPPSPKLEIFAGVRLLLGLEDPERQASKTPWWLLLLRIVAVAAVILGFAQPVLNPTSRLAEAGEGPVLILMDQGWASAPDWDARRAAAAAALDEAGQEGRQVLLWLAAEAPGTAPPPMDPAGARQILEAARPAPVAPGHDEILAALEGGDVAAFSQTLWLHDGMARGEATEELLDLLVERGPLRLIGPAETARGLTAPELVDGRMEVEVLAAERGAGTADVLALAELAEGGERRIAMARAEFGQGDARAAAVFDIPTELIAQVSRVVLADGASAGGAALADAAIKRVPVAVVDPASDGTVATLTSARHYLQKALVPWADVTTGSLDEAIARDPAAIFLADQGDFSTAERDALLAWVEEGGLLVRFAGPRLAAAIGEGAGGVPSAAAVQGEDPLLPVRLRRGGRMLGGALAWGSPRTLGPFDPQGPFRRLSPPEEVAVRTQVLAEPSPDLSGRVWATLDDGTPLVTAAERGEGRVVLFHVSAETEWSSLPISGLFVEMLGRLVALAPGQASAAPSEEELQGTLWRLDLVMGPDGAPVPPAGIDDPVQGEKLVGGVASRAVLPGLYARVDAGPRAAGAAESLVINLHRRGDTLEPFPPAPPGAVSERLGGVESVKLAAPLLLLAIILAAIDTAATLWLSGRLPAPRRPRPAEAAAVLLAAALAIPGGAEAQDDAARAVAEAAETSLGYVLTGDSRTDWVSERALIGLGNQLTRRTAVEPGPPFGVDAERDELSLFPVLYWPLTSNNVPTDVALERLARYLAGGGLLVIDTQNGSAGFNGASAAEMRQIARALNLPPLAPVDGDHVLSRTFYLLNAFPGRWRGGRVWAEAPPVGQAAAEADPDLPQFDRIDDNVSPVVVGSADWASAWAVDDQGVPLFPVGRPGDRQREMAIRFGVNLVMYALTGNYKSDQVHAPAVLQRLGQ